MFCGEYRPELLQQKDTEGSLLRALLPKRSPLCSLISTSLSYRNFLSSLNAGLLTEMLMFGFEASVLTLWMKLDLSLVFSRLNRFRCDVVLELFLSCPLLDLLGRSLLNSTFFTTEPIWLFLFLWKLRASPALGSVLKALDRYKSRLSLDATDLLQFFFLNQSRILFMALSLHSWYVFSYYLRTALAFQKVGGICLLSRYCRNFYFYLGQSMDYQIILRVRTTKAISFLLWSILLNSGQFLAKFLLTQTLTLPCLLMPTMSAETSKQPVFSNIFWQPSKEHSIMYSPSSSGISISSHSRKWILSRYTAAEWKVEHMPFLLVGSMCTEPTTVGYFFLSQQVSKQDKYSAWLLKKSSYFSISIAALLLWAQTVKLLSQVGSLMLVKGSHCTCCQSSAWNSWWSGCFESEAPISASFFKQLQTYNNHYNFVPFSTDYYSQDKVQSAANLRQTDSHKQPKIPSTKVITWKGSDSSGYGVLSTILCAKRVWF